MEPLTLKELRPAFEIWAVLMSDMGQSYDSLVTEGGRVSLRREILKYMMGRSGHTGSVLTMIGIQRLLDRLPDRVDAMNHALEGLRARLDELLVPGSIMLHPPFARVAPRHRTIAVGHPADVGLSSIFNILGIPVAVAPIASFKGLPTSVQVVAGRAQDHVACAAAIALEEARGPVLPVEPRRGPPMFPRRGR